jgi:hypothetical protein
MRVPEVNNVLPLVDPATGKLSIEGHRLFTQIILVLKSQQAVDDDHESRITALEP